MCPMNFFFIFLLLNCSTVYVLASCNIGPQISLKADDAYGGWRFGSSVALSGTTIVVGSQVDDTKGFLGGSAYFFTESGGVWTQAQKVFASDSGDNYPRRYGADVVIAGQVAIVGAYDDSNTQGSAYVYTENSPGSWSEAQKLTAFDAANDDFFGESLGVTGTVPSDTTLFIGAKADDDFGSYSGSIYVYTESSPGTWSFTQKLHAADTTTSDAFGICSAMDGGLAIIGARHKDNGVGAAYIFSETVPGTWAEDAKLVSGDPSTIQEFGWPVAIDGTKALISAVHDGYNGGYGAGAVYIFEETAPGSWSMVQRLLALDGASSDFFGFNVAISGNVALIGAAFDDDVGSSSGSVYLFQEDIPGTWVQTTKITSDFGGDNNNFGSHVDIDLTSGWAVMTEPKHFSSTGQLVIVGVECVDDCAVNSCEHGSTCIDGFQDYSCECYPSHNGDMCELCSCVSGVCAENTGDSSWYCDCTGTDSAGELCETACENGGTDDATNNWTTCNCKDVNAIGVLCEYTCNNGMNNIDFTACNCSNAGATGTYCQNDVDDCNSNPCAHAGVCTDLGDELFPARNHEFNCSCSGGWMGPTCEDTLCISSPCQNGAVCDNGYDLKCNCTGTGYQGKFCDVNIDDCAENPCLNEGNCTDLVNGYECTCDGTGYDGFTCADDIDDCASSPCQNGGSCEDKGANKFKCTCAGTGFEGSLCDADIDDCLSAPCLNDGTCTDAGANAFACNCTDTGYSDILCDVEVDECVSSPCENGGVCKDRLGKFRCECGGTGYEGDICELDVDDCISAPCMNGASCIDNGTNTVACTCVDGYTGIFCEAEISDDDAAISNCTGCDTETMISFELKFTDFAYSNETLINFQLQCPWWLANAVGMGSTADDFRVEVIPQSDGSYLIAIDYSNSDGSADPSVVIERASDPDGPIGRHTTDLTLVDTIQAEPEDPDGEGSNNSSGLTIFYVLIIAIIVIILTLAAWKYNKSKRKVVRDMDGNTMTMPV